jgi:hypothetical protein
MASALFWLMFLGVFLLLERLGSWVLEILRMGVRVPSTLGRHPATGERVEDEADRGRVTPPRGEYTPSFERAA